MLSVAENLACQFEHYKFLLSARPNDASIRYSIIRLLDRAKTAKAEALVKDINQFIRNNHAS